MPEPIIDQDKLLTSINAGDSAGIDECLRSVAEWKSDTLSGIGLIREGPEKYDRYLGVQLLISYLRGRGDMLSAIALARELFKQLENDAYILSGERPDLRMLAAKVLDALNSCLLEAGNTQEIFTEADQWTEWLQRIDMVDYYLAQIHLYKAEALMVSGEYDEARDLLSIVKSEELRPSQKFSLNRLNAKMPVLIRAVDQPEPKPVDMKEFLMNAVETLHGIMKADEPTLGRTTDEPRVNEAAVEPVPVGVTAAMDALGGGTPYTDNVDEIVKRAEKLAESRDPFKALREVTDGLSVFFQDEKKSHEVAALERIVGALDKTIDYAGKMGFWEEQVNIQWLLAITCKRLGRLKEAAAVLRQMRDEIDRRRVAINDPRNRAAVAVYLPNLYPVSVEILYQLGEDHIQELFSVIESAKGKILAELAGKQPFCDKDADGSVLRQHERELLRELIEVLKGSADPACYMTLLVDIDATYAVVVDHQGNLFRHKIDLTRAQIESAAQRLKALCDGDSNDLMRCGPIDPYDPWARPFAPEMDSLAPLAALIGTYAEKAGVLAVSPDSALFDIPLHMLEIDGRPLIAQVGIAVVPSADVLLLSAKRYAESPRPVRATCFLVPQEQAATGEEGDAAAFRHVADSLAGCISTEVIEGKDADLAHLKTEDLAGNVVLFAAHGIFQPGDPLGASGVYLAGKGGSSGGPDVPELTPKEILGTKDKPGIDLEGARVAFLACVSGKTIEITSKEALGMIWSAFRAGAVNILASAWKVNAKSSAQLVSNIYREWLTEKRPMWQAHQAAMLALRAADKNTSHPYHWAPFVLYGYWQ
jgi:tetratricopeptide (TPR) repeat protein